MSCYVMVRLPAGSSHRLPWWHGLYIRCVVSCGNTSSPWLVFFFAAQLWGSMIHKHTGRWMWQGEAAVVSWSWEKCSSYSKLVSTLSMLLSSVLSCRVFQAWNTHQLTTEHWYLKLTTVSSFCPLTLITLLIPLVLFVISLVFPALISKP